MDTDKTRRPTNDETEDSQNNNPDYKIPQLFINEIRVEVNNNQQEKNLHEQVIESTSVGSTLTLYYCVHSFTSYEKKMTIINE